MAMHPSLPPSLPLPLKYITPHIRQALFSVQLLKQQLHLSATNKIWPLFLAATAVFHPQQQLLTTKSMTAYFQCIQQGNSPLSFTSMQNITHSNNTGEVYSYCTSEKSFHLALVTLLLCSDVSHPSFVSLVYLE